MDSSDCSGAGGLLGTGLIAKAEIEEVLEVTGPTNKEDMDPKEEEMLRLYLGLMGFVA